MQTVRRLVLVVLAWVAAAAPALAQDGAAGAPVRDRGEAPAKQLVKLRVLTVDANGRATVDRGARDGLVVGDAVLLFPRNGGARRATVVQVEDRSSVLELDAAGDTTGLVPGVRGETRLPAERFADPVEEDAADGDEEQPETSETTSRERPPIGGTAEEPVPELERPPWEYQDDGWRPGMPLLSRIRAVRPEDRARRVSGRGYLILDRTWTTEDEREDSQVRLGTSLLIENPFKLGGEVRFDGEYDRRMTEIPDDPDENETYPRVERISYAWGGGRFAPDRFEVGRFLQRTLPEFGVVDGIQWERRLASGDRWGASLGYLPELNFDFDSGDDLAVAAWYHWAVDSDERLTVTNGFQKSWHEGKPDRDLLVTKVRYLPLEGWNFHGTTWIDFYGSEDDAKDSGPEVTHAILTGSKDFDGKRQMDVTFRRLRFPELLRTELLPVAEEQLANDRYDRLSAGGWTEMRGDRRLHGEVGVWDDEDDSGGDLQLGLIFQDWLWSGSRTNLTGFATLGRFSTSGGARVDFGVGDSDGRWDFLYEASLHRQEGFTSAIDDFAQHRLRGSRSLYSFNGWSVFFDLEAQVYDDEGAFSIGLHLEESF